MTRIITDAGKPNGICVSPDQKTLYVIANDNGSLDQVPDGERRNLAEGPDCDVARLRARARRHGQQSPRAGRLVPPMTAATA